MADKVKVRLMPDNVNVEVEPGMSIMEIASDAGMYLNSICGGHGSCGYCKVQVKDRDFSGMKESKFISKDEASKGFCLACQTVIDVDSEVLIPAQTRVSKPQILTKASDVVIERIDPIIDKVYLELTPPSLSDNVGDLERVQRALGDIERFNGKKFDTSIPVLQKLSGILHSAEWKATLTICMGKDPSQVYRIIDIEPGNTEDRKLGLAIDIGTTTVVIELVDLKTGAILGIKSDYNHQITYGEDVLSRIFYAEENGSENLTRLVLETMNNLITDIVRDRDIRRSFPGLTPEQIYCVTVAGNTVMTHLFLGINPVFIKSEPYIPTLNQVPIQEAGKLGLINARSASVYCMPSRSSYVGGDITADILVTGMHHSSELSMLIDVGTNGEIVLGNKDWLMACSCSAGPSFEGGEVKHGMRASAGAIEKVTIDFDFEPKCSTIGNAKPRGICGSGLIDLIAELVMVKAIDRSGSFNNHDTPRIRTGDEGGEYVIVWAQETEEGHEDIVLTEADIKNIIRTKSAIYAAASTLLHSVNYEFTDLDRIYIAGGFGNFIDSGKAILIGLLPDVPMDKFNFIGNGSLAGARLALISAKHRAEAVEIFNKLTYLELSVDNRFFNEFTSAMFLPHTSISKFPTVRDIYKNR